MYQTICCESTTFEHGRCQHAVQPVCMHLLGAAQDLEEIGHGVTGDIAGTKRTVGLAHFSRLGDFGGLATSFPA